MPAAPPAKTPAQSPATTPFALIGGERAVRAIVNRFYDLVEHDPAFAALRALHATDLAPVRHGLERFLTGWLGGPRDWFDRGICIMSMHRAFPITPAVAQEWADAMARAVAQQDGLDPEIGALMVDKLTGMAHAMINLGVSARA
ncbi:group II truncated hemoglobin [soil metagenome]